MKAYLVYEPEGKKRNEEYIKMFKAAGSARGVEFSCVMCGDVPRLPLPDFAVVRAMRPDVTKFFEEKGVPVFNNYKVSYISNNKARTYEYLAANGVPVMDFKSGDKNAFPEDIEYPAVIKPCCGHGGKNVMIIKNDAEYKAARELIAPDGFVVQPIAEKLGYDKRVYILGNRPVAAVQRIGNGDDFRSNFSLGGKVLKSSLTEEESSLVERVCSLFDFALCGIDIMYDGGRAVVNEIEDVVGSRMLYATHEDIDIVKMYVDYILKTL